MKKKNKKKKAVLLILGLLLLFLSVRAVMPGWTPKINSENSISELRVIHINGADFQMMIRGWDKDNPVPLFVHGGPCCSEIPYARKYQEELEKEFTIVHYDQRGSGKSYRFGEDYSQVTAATHVEDLIAITENIEEYLDKEQVILLGHSYGTYVATQAAALRPDLYRAYIGIGQMSDTVKSELNTLEKCRAQAVIEGDEKTIAELEALKEAVTEGKQIVPRNYVRKYGFGARLIDDNRDYLLAFLFGSEYNLRDAAGFYTAAMKYQDGLIMEALRSPLADIVSKIDIPVYFVMGKYDGMTSPEAAEEYLQNIEGDGEKVFVLFENSAHYPQFEEKEEFDQWMQETFN